MALKFSWVEDLLYASYGSRKTNVRFFHNFNFFLSLVKDGSLGVFLELISAGTTI